MKIAIIDRGRAKFLKWLNADALKLPTDFRL